MKKVKRVIFWLTLGVAIAAVVEQLRRPQAQRDWHGSILGVPYDFRRPSLDRIRRTWWNPNDRRLLVPRAFGVGWDINWGSLFPSRAEPDAGDETV